MTYDEQIKKRYKKTVNFIGVVLIIAGVIMLLPLLSLPFYRNEFYIAKYFLITAFVNISIGLFLRSRFKEVDRTIRLSLAEGGIIIVSSWFFTILLSSFPFIFSGMLNFHQGMFEAVSGWTTTGLSVIEVDSAPRIILLWRSIMQFFGGAGFSIIMLSAIIGPHGIGMQSIEGRNDKLLPTIEKSTRIFFMIYFTYFAVGLIAYLISGMSFFDALNHSMTAISTGGFSTKAESIGSFDSSAIEMVTVILMLIGSTGFGAHFLLFNRRVKDFFKIDEIRLFAKLIIIGMLVVVFILIPGVYSNTTLALKDSLFQLVSSLSTTGFSSVDFTAWPVLPIFIMIIFMSIGGGVGSTAGGIKLYRVDLILKAMYFNVRNYLKPESLVETGSIYRVEGKQYISKWYALEAANFVILYFTTYLLGVIVFLAYGFPFKESVFEFASCIGTVGLSTGLTAASAPVGIMWTQIFGMILGRLEILIVFFAFIKLYNDGKFIIKRREEE